MGAMEGIKLSTKNIILSSKALQQAQASFTFLLSNNSSSPSDISLSSSSLINLHTIFTSQCTSLLSLIDQLELRIKKIEERENNIEQRTHQLREKEIEYTLKDRKLVAREYSLRIKYHEEEEERRKKMEEETKHDELLPSVIKLNVSMFYLAFIKLYLSNINHSFRRTRYSLVKKNLHFGGSSFEQLLLKESTQLATTGAYGL